MKTADFSLKLVSGSALYSYLFQRKLKNIRTHLR